MIDSRILTDHGMTVIPPIGLPSLLVLLAEASRHRSGRARPDRAFGRSGAHLLRAGETTSSTTLT